MITRLKSAVKSTRFICGMFSGFVITTLGFTCILVNLYTPNILLEHTGFYKDGAYFMMVEKSKLGKNCVK